MQCPFFIFDNIEQFWNRAVFQLHHRKGNKARHNWKLTSKAEFLENVYKNMYFMDYSEAYANTLHYTYIKWKLSQWVERTCMQVQHRK